MESSEDNRPLELEQVNLNHLETIRKWTTFLAILGFIVLSIILILGIIAGLFLTFFKTGSDSSAYEGILVFLLILIISVIYLFPGLFLLRFSKHIANAVKTHDKTELTKAFKCLKSYFVCTGILIIVVLTVYLVVFTIAGTSAAFLNNIG